MSSYSAVRVVSEMVRDVIAAGLQSIPGGLVAELNDLRPPPSGIPPTVAVFLYEVVEDPTMRNRGRIERQRPSGSPAGREYVSTKSSLALILRYLVVPYGGNRVSEYEMLGRTMQALHQRSVRSAPDLPNGLDPAEAVTISLAPLSLEERTRVWWSISQPYRLSLNYEVRVVEIDVDPDLVTAPVVEREFGFDLVEART